MMAHVLMALAMVSLADDFERLEGQVLSSIPRSAVAKPSESLTITDLGNLPNVLSGTRSPVLIVKTDEGNYARLLVSPALRKPPGGEGEPIPILIVERFDTFEGGSATRRMARGRDLTLFDGFRLDLDSGQVVPEGQGGDLQYLGKGEAQAKLVSTKPATMFTLTASPLPAAERGGGLSGGRAIAPGDFAGTYRLFANGQSSGRLDLKVDGEGLVSGRLRSDQTGGSYKITGDVGKNAPNQIRFTAELPRTRQEFEGLIFLEGKGAIAGSFALLGRTFGFFALREGGTVVVDGEDLGPKVPAAEAPGKHVLNLARDGMSLDSESVDEGGLAARLKTATETDPACWVVIQPADDVAAGRLLKIVDVVRDAGVIQVRLAPAR